MKFWIVALVVLVLAGAAAFGLRGQDPTVAAAQASTALAAAHAAMMSGTDGKAAGHSRDPDLDFVTQMIPHVEAAIAMAKVQLQYGSNEPARAIADEIVKAQSAELAEMTKWMEAHTAVPSPDAPAARAAFDAANRKMAAGIEGEHVHSNADQAFIGMMIPHHQGAIDLAAVEVQYGKDPVIRALAGRIITRQQAEIVAMNEMALGGGHKH